MEIIGYVAAIFIGIVLGLIGGGGSILAFPILVYLFKIDADQATCYSLFIVGFTALVGALKQYRLGNLQIKSGLIFAIPSVISLLTILIIKTTTTMAIPGWASTLGSSMIIILLISFIISLFSIFIYLSTQTQRKFIPAMHYHDYILQTEII